MGELGKVVRWSAPGSVFILMAFAFAGFGRVVFAQHLWPVSGGASLLPWPQLSGGGVALLAVASVPLGFIMYQIYYFGYSRPQPLVLSFVHLDVALRVEEELGQANNGSEKPEWVVRRTDGLFLRLPRHTRVPLTGKFTSLWLFRTDADGSCRDGTSGNPRDVEARVATSSDKPLTIAELKREEKLSTAEARRAYSKILNDYARTRESNWMALESQLHRRLRGRSGSDRDFQSIERLADVFHTLGAAKTAVAYAWLGGCAWVTWRVLIGSDSDFSAQNVSLVVLFTVASLVVAALLYLLLHENRRHCSHRRISLIVETLGEALPVDSNDSESH